MQRLIAWLFAFQLCVLASALTPSLYIGVGYNIVKGNPDSWIWSELGHDPGLLLTRNILQITLPSYVQEVPYPSCFPTRSSSVFYDPKSYLDHLKSYFRILGSARDGSFEYAFTKNQEYLDIKSKTLIRHDVIRDEMFTCLTDHARFSITRLPNDNLISTEFAIDACSLPNVYDASAYRNFLNSWGTHVTMEVDLGRKNVTRYHLTDADLAEFILNTHKPNAADLKIENFEGYGSVVVLNMSHILHSDFVKLHLGTNPVNHATMIDIPIAWTLKPISEVMVPLYWRNEQELISSGICSSLKTSNLSVWKSNLERALREYAVGEGGEISQKSLIKLPVTWPTGTYGLPQPKTGCPNDPTRFETGHLNQDMEDTHNTDRNSSSFHLSGTVDSGEIVTHFCMKRLETTNDYNREWPKGDYCIFKKNNCPNGFSSGFLFFDDENNNANSHGGVLPDGVYTHDTKIEFCCRQDGLAINPILLPIDKPFYLFRYHDNCQQVIGMSIAYEFIKFDTENDSNKDECGGSHPDVGSTCHDFTLQYCYYSPYEHLTNIDIPAVVGKK